MPIEEVLQRNTAPRDISPQAVQDQLQRLLDSSLFTHSRRYPSFLSYVVDQSLKGRGSELKERTIGIEVFGRKPEYDLAADPVVRQTAGEVRKRLAQYYYEPEHREELRIELHLGSYNPDFKLAPTHGVQAPLSIIKAAAPLPQEIAPPVAASIVEGEPAEGSEVTPSAAPVIGPERGAVGRFLMRKWLPLALVACVLLIATAVAFVFYAHKDPPALERLWQPVVKASAPVLISVGSWAEQSSAPDAVSIESHAKTSGPIALADTVAIAGLQQFLSQHATASTIQTAGQTSFSDLQHGPVILVSAFDNPWTMRLTDPLRFHFVQRTQTLLAIEDRKDPSRKDWQIDTAIPYSGLTRDFGLIARFHDPTTGQVVVVAAGIGENGTMAAGKVLTNEEFLQAAGRESGLDSGYRNMEAVVETQVIDGKSGPPQIVALTFW
jgi:hypothetical protein